MSNKHLRRPEILPQLISGKLPTSEAAQLHSMTTGQVRCLRHRFTTEGVESVVHANTGRAPQSRTDPILIERLHLLAGRGGIYHDFTFRFDGFFFAHLARSWRDDVTGIAKTGYVLTAAGCLNSWQFLLRPR